jgi:hypothetical protein
MADMSVASELRELLGFDAAAVSGDGAEERKQSGDA